MRLSLTPLPLALVVLTAALAPTPVSAGTTPRLISQLAVGLCGANNPANDPSLRRLVTGLKNAGTSNVSVVCGQWGDDNTAASLRSVSVHFKNDKAVGANISCTLTVGTPFYSQISITKTWYVAAGGTAALGWDHNEYGENGDQQWANMQCSLPGAFTLRELLFVYDEEIGT